ncbi:glycosyl hydrolase 53 family protein [Paenibacillus sp. CAU 1782]
MQRKWFRNMAGLLAAVMIVSLFPWGELKVHAATDEIVPTNNLKVNGNAAQWLLNGEWPANLSDDAGAGALGYWDGSFMDFTLTHKLTGLAPGTYKLTAKTYGDKGEPAAGSVMFAQTESGNYNTPVTYTGSGWTSPRDLSLDGIEVGENGEAVIGFTVKASAEHYGYFKDVVFAAEQGPTAGAILISPNGINLRPGATQELAIRTSSANNAQAIVLTDAVYSSSDESVATVAASGVVTAAGDGEAVITVSGTIDGNPVSGKTSVFVSGSLQQLGDSKLFVQPVAELQDGKRSDFIMGADISTILAIQQSGRRYYDLNGAEKPLMDILKENGVNWIRLRLWNDPKDENGNWYGAGNVNKAAVIEMAQQAKAAGLKVLVDFHYSDFWADPARQKTPKAWASFNETQLQQAVYDYTLDVVSSLADAGAYPDMVQVGNEINDGMMWPLGKSPAAAAKYIEKGIQAVRQAETDKGGDRIRVLLHRANPDHGPATLKAFYNNYKDLDYDVIGLSYYPFWHGTFANIRNVMNELSATFDKDVVIAETSYAFTLEDVPNNGPTGHVFNETSEKIGGYKSTVSGQASAIRDVIAAVAEVPNERGIGVFYWEPAWLPGVDTGWGTKYAATYQGEEIPEDGGSGWSNQAMFNFFGEAIPSIEVFNLVRGDGSGYTAPALVEVENVSVVTSEGINVPLPDKSKGLYEDGAYREITVLSWTPTAYNYEKAGTYSAIGTLEGGGQIEASITVRPKNYVVNPGFESSNMSAWVLNNSSRTGEAPYSGSYALHFWNRSLITAKQTVEGLPDGVYTLSMMSRIGANAGPIGESYMYAEVDGEILKTALTVSGWNDWNRNEIAGIEVSNGTLEIGAVVTDAIEAGGDFDDWELIRTGDLPGSGNPGEPGEGPGEPGEGPGNPEAPAVPTGVAATAGNGYVDLKWNAVNDEGLAGYNVYVNGVKQNPAVEREATVTESVYRASGLSNGTAYSFQVSALGENGVESALSGAVNATPQAPSTQNPIVTLPNVPSVPSGKVVNNPQRDAEGNAEVGLESGENKVLLPAGLTELDGSRKLIVKTKDLTIEIPGKVVEALKQSLQSNVAGAYIALEAAPLEQNDESRLLALAGDKSGAELKQAGPVINLTLSVIDRDGKETKLSTFSQPVELKWTVPADANSDFLGVYYIGEDGALQYVGGTLSAGVMTAQVSHFSAYALLEYNKSFLDVGEQHWAFRYIKALAAKLIITGKTQNEFAPGDHITRAEFAALLVRSLGLTANSSGTPFADVDNSVWYAPAVAAASEAGLITGRSAERFAPEEIISRQELAVMLIRAYELREGQAAKAGSTAAFQDQDYIAAWADNAVGAAVELGFLQGRGDGVFAPQAPATRAESAKLLALLLGL